MGGRTGWAQAGVTAVRVFLRGGQPSREFVLMSVRLCHVPSVAGLTDYTCVCVSVICVCGPFFLEPGFEQFKVSERSHRNWIRLYLEENNSEVVFNLGAKVRRQYLDALRTLKLSLSRRAAQYDVYSMAVGTVLVLEVRVPGQGHCVTGRTAPPTFGSQRTWRFGVSGRGQARALFAQSWTPAFPVPGPRPAPAQCPAGAEQQG